MLATNTKGTKGFFIWLQRRLPRVYSEVKKEFRDAAQLNGIGLSSDPIATATEAPGSSTLVKTISEIANVAAQAYLTREQIKAQQSILNTNLQRMQQGLAPLDINPAQYGLQPSVGVGVTADTKQMLMYGAIGFGVLWMASSAMSGSRRR